VNGWQALAIIGSVVGSVIAIVLGVVRLAGARVKKPCEDLFLKEEERMNEMEKGIEKGIDDSRKTDLKLELLRQEVGWIKTRMTEMEKQIGKLLDKMQLIYLEMTKRKDNHSDNKI
jgi:hypothetical protein